MGDEQERDLMTIYLYSGRPGSGKSYAAAKLCKDTLKRKKQDVIANFEIVVGEDWRGNFFYVPNSQLSVDVLLQYAANYWRDRKFKEDGLLVVLDEAQLLWNSRLWQDAERMRWLELWSQHRKYGLKIVLIAQADIMIDKQFRSLIEFEVNHRKISSFGLFGLILRALAFSELFYQCETFYAQKYKVDGRILRYSKRIGDLYNSYKAFDRQQVGQPASSYQVVQDYGGVNDGYYQQNLSGLYEVR